MLNDSYDVNGRQDKQIILRASDGHIVFPSFSMRFLFLVFSMTDVGFVKRQKDDSTSDSACSTFFFLSIRAIIISVMERWMIRPRFGSNI